MERFFRMSVEITRGEMVVVRERERVETRSVVVVGCDVPVWSDQPMPYVDASHFVGSYPATFTRPS